MTEIIDRIKTFINKHSHTLICLFLIMSTFAVYGQVQHHDFINYDDDVYVYDNSHIQKGLTIENILWAFTTTHAANWHPLTWLSHMLDCQLFGMNPGWHHLTNLLFHITNTLLLFFIFRKMTGDIWQSGFVAALFALHPLHVESVAWIAERKDVISTFFWMLTTWSYVRYVEQISVNRYLLALLFFILGLMAKPMLVTLPFVLLLLDFWPLRRFQLRQSKWHLDKEKSQVIFRLLLEKMPFLAFTVMSSVITFFAQKQAGALASLDIIPFQFRVANAIVSYLKYIEKMIYPSKLAFFYPYPQTISRWQLAGACFFIVSLSLLAVYAYRRWPYITVGWFWYLGTLVPVVGLIQVGSQAMADRYTYISLIGLFIILAWVIPELIVQLNFRKIGFAISAILLSILLASTWKQARYWANNISLYIHALSVTKNNYIAHNNLGLEFASQGILDEAENHYSKALRIKPNYAQALYNKGNLFYKKGKVDEAIIYYRKAISVKSNYVNACGNLGVALYTKGKTEESITCFRKALKLRPNYPLAQKNLMIALTKRRKDKNHFTKVEITQNQNPNNAELHYKQGNLYKFNGKLDEALDQYKKVLSIQPMFTPALNDLALIYIEKEEFARAFSLFKKIIDLQPNNYVTYYNIACMYSKQKKIDEAVDWLKKAVKRGFKDWEFLEGDEDLKNIRGTFYYKTLTESIKKHRTR